MAKLSAPAYTTFTGTAAGEFIFATSGNESIAALGGNDVIFGIGGNDTIDGGAGSDIVQYTGSYANYSITQDAITKSFTITDLRSGAPDGTDVVFNVESFYFADGSFSATTLINQAPNGLTLTGASIAENSKAGTLLGTLKGSDPNPGDTLTYSLIDSAGGRFVVNATTGAITVANGAVLDFETTPTLALTARVTDNRGLSYDKIFTINLTNVNEAPTALTLNGGTIAENSAAGTVVGTVKGIDPDAGAVLTYSLTNNAGGKFVIDANTGVITVAQGAVLDFETTPQLTIAAKVTDQAGLSFTKNLVVSLTNVNEGPTALTLTGGTVKENSAAGTVVGTVKGTDPDKGDVLTYSLTENANGRFVINATTGVITVAQGAVLDFETTPQIALTARVTDQGGLTYEKVFTVNLSNVNEAPTALNLTGGTILAKSKAGSMVGTLQGSDPDSGDVLTYSLTDNANGRFVINAKTGVISVANGAVLDDTLTPQLSITAKVTDKGGLSYTQSFNITVTSNQAPTGLTLTGGTLAENSAAGTLIGSLQGTDPNQGDKLTYSLVDNAKGRFVVNSATGAITVAQGAVLDFETTPQITLTARVTDQGGLSYTKAFTINLTNVNEAPTIDPDQSFTINGYSSLAGTVVGKVKATDPDMGDVLTYKLLYPNDFFSIDPNTGVISLTQKIDYQQSFGSPLYVRVTDQNGLTSSTLYPIWITINNPGINVTMIGDANYLIGSTGDDTLTAISYNFDSYSFIFGGAGNDTISLLGNRGNIDGGDGNDYITYASSYGYESDNVIRGGAGNDTLVGGTTGYYYGDSGNDWFLFDQSTGMINTYFTVDGGAGNDHLDLSWFSLRYGQSIDLTSIISLGDDGSGSAIFASNSSSNQIYLNVSFSNLEQVSGSQYSDSIIGGSRNDTIEGRGGNDTIDGGGGDDIISVYTWGFETGCSLFGGDGNDGISAGLNSTIDGGAGNDTLVDGMGGGSFSYSASGFGQDIIYSFRTTIDVFDEQRPSSLLINTTLFADWNALLSATRQVGSDLVITYSPTDTITLKNVALANFTQQDVVFRT